MKKFENKVINNYKGRPLVYKGVAEGKESVLELKVENVFWIIYNEFSALPYNVHAKTQNDTIQALRLIEALEKQKDAAVIEIEDGVWDWLKAIAPIMTYQIFFPNGEIIMTLIKDGFIKAEAKDK
jgi:hypothetical protein